MRWTLLVGLAACGGVSPAPRVSEDPPAAPASDDEPAPEERALDPAIAEMAELTLALDAALADAAGEIPGAAAAVVTPLGIWLGATGFADLAEREPMTVDTRLYLGSLSKPLTAATVLALTADERVALEAPLTDSLPQYQCGGESTVRVRDLLTHTAGIPREGGMEYWFTGVFPTDDELRDQLVAGALEHRPGSVWTYSNVGYAALGPLIAARGRCHSRTRSAHSCLSRWA